MTKNLNPIEIALVDIDELNEPYWYDPENPNDIPTCRSIALHAKLIEETDLSHPIIVDPESRVMDGMHRVCKALNMGLAKVRAYRLPQLPEPDYVGIAMEALPD